MTAPAETTSTQRQAIRDELEETRVAFHALLDSIPDEAMEQPTSNPAWNVRQMLYHIIMAVEMLPQDIKLIRKRRLISPPARLFNFVTIYMTRWQARKHTRRSLTAAYDSAHATVLELLGGIKDDEWSLVGNYPDVGSALPGGERTIHDVPLSQPAFRRTRPGIRPVASELRVITIASFFRNGVRIGAAVVTSAARSRYWNQVKIMNPKTRPMS